MKRFIIILALIIVGNAGQAEQMRTCHVSYPYDETWLDINLSKNWKLQIKTDKRVYTKYINPNTSKNEHESYPIQFVMEKSKKCIVNDYRFIYIKCD